MERRRRARKRRRVEAAGGTGGGDRERQEGLRQRRNPESYLPCRLWRGRGRQEGVGVAGVPGYFFCYVHTVAATSLIGNLGRLLCCSWGVHISWHGVNGCLVGLVDDLRALI